MENKYRNMMDEVRASETLRESVLDMTGRERTKKTRPAPTRVLLAAACICALLVVGAVAVAEVIGVNVGPVLSGEELSGVLSSKNPAGYNGYVVTIDGGFSWDRVSEELQAEAKANMQNCIYNAYFDSQAELEAALGFELPHNPILDAAQEIEGRSKPSESEEWIPAFAHLQLFGTDEMLDRLFLSTNYTISNPEHVEHGDVSSRFACTGEVTVVVQYNGRERGTSTNTHISSISEFAREEYVTPNGLQAVIIQEGKGHHFYRGYVTVDGMVLEVIAHGYRNCTDVKGVLTSILDAYQ